VVARLTDPTGYATLEHVFDDCPVVHPQRPTRRLVSPPCRVVVNLLTGLPNRLADFRNVALFTRVDGLELTRPRVGVLVAWVQQTSGRWWGLVELEFVTGSGRGRLRVRQLFSASALTPAPAEPESPTPVHDRSG